MQMAISKQNEVEMLTVIILNAIRTKQFQNMFKSYSDTKPSCTKIF